MLVNLVYNSLILFSALNSHTIGVDDLQLQLSYNGNNHTVEYRLSAEKVHGVMFFAVVD